MSWIGMGIMLAGNAFLLLAVREMGKQVKLLGDTVIALMKRVAELEKLP